MATNFMAIKRPPRNVSLIDKLAHYSMPEPNSGCVLWLGGVNNIGYGTIRWAGRETVAHRLSWESVNGPIPNGLRACHKCDVRSCINPAHLFLGTQLDNVADMFAKGRNRTLSGDAHGSAILSEDKVRAIRRDARATQKIASDYGVARSTIEAVRYRWTWKHVA